MNIIFLTPSLVTQHIVIQWQEYAIISSFITTILNITVILLKYSADSSIFVSLVTSNQRSRNFIVIFGASMIILILVGLNNRMIFQKGRLARNMS
uniref:Uncharacterized protein n=1 Tax=Octopus bimaculoides TaxID=37653 RepID=A0A0L8FID6_OCTBM